LVDGWTWVMAALLVGQIVAATINVRHAERDQK
jgi:hypothetical protein